MEITRHLALSDYGKGVFVEVLASPGTYFDRCFTAEFGGVEIIGEINDNDDSVYFYSVGE